MVNEKPPFYYIKISNLDGVFPDFRRRLEELGKQKFTRDVAETIIEQLQVFKQKNELYIQIEMVKKEERI